jgi:hypothetical protein
VALTLELRDYRSYVDPILQRTNGTTMLELWNGDATCLKITARMLMGMRSGMVDYNDTWYERTRGLSRSAAPPHAPLKLPRCHALTREKWRTPWMVLRHAAQRAIVMKDSLEGDRYYWVTVNEPERDITPLDLLHVQNKSWGCEPGTCGQCVSRETSTRINA